LHGVVEVGLLLVTVDRAVQIAVFLKAAGDVADVGVEVVVQVDKKALRKLIAVDRAIAVAVGVVKCDGVVETARNLRDTGQGYRGVRLAVPVVAPSDNRAVVLEGVGEVSAASDLSDTDQVAWLVELADRQVAPSDKCSIVLKGVGVRVATRDLCDAAQVAGSISLAKEVAAPPDKRSIVLEGVRVE
jgi:hypothetical protein